MLSHLYSRVQRCNIRASRRVSSMVGHYADLSPFIAFMPSPLTHGISLCPSGAWFLLVIDTAAREDNAMVTVTAFRSWRVWASIGTLIWPQNDSLLQSIQVNLWFLRNLIHKLASHIYVLEIKGYESNELFFFLSMFSYLENLSTMRRSAINQKVTIRNCYLSEPKDERFTGSMNTRKFMKITFVKVNRSSDLHSLTHGHGMISNLRVKKYVWVVAQSGTHDMSSSISG